MLGLAAGDHGFDPSLAEEPTVFVVVVAAVSEQALGAVTRTAGNACRGRDPVEQRDQLGDVVAVPARERVGEREPGCVDEDVVLAAFPAATDRARARFGAPFFACR